MTVADLLDMILDPEWNLEGTATVRAATGDGMRVWEIEGAHGHAGSSDPEVVLELKEIA